MHCQR
jgi:hypothetical protein